VNENEPITAAVIAVDAAVEVPTTVFAAAVTVTKPVANVAEVLVVDPNRSAETRLEFAGTATKVAVNVATVIASEAATAALNGITTGVPTAGMVGVEVALVRVYSAGAALEGAAESIPKPNEATATSAMRLKVVFVDICFLSISRSEDFPPFGFG
jgi:hypothetical protein